MCVIFFLKFLLRRDAEQISSDCWHLKFSGNEIEKQTPPSSRIFPHRILNTSFCYMKLRQLNLSPAARVPPPPPTLFRPALGLVWPSEKDDSCRTKTILTTSGLIETKASWRQPCYCRLPPVTAFICYFRALYLIIDNNWIIGKLQYCRDSK